MAEPPAGPTTTSGFDVRRLALLLDGDHHELRQKVRSVLSRPRFAYRYGLDRDRYRGLVVRWLRVLAGEGFGVVAFPKEVGGGGDPTAWVAVFETVAFHDASLLVKFGVQFGLFGGAITGLGTERHHRQYLGKVGTFELPGCFAMTETGHGSNVRDLGTVATFDPEGDEFVVHTPEDSARKDFIGNAAAHGRMAAVFAQLEVGGERHGVHALLVPLRDTRGRTLPGIRIEDCGEKLGLNGVDNGRIWFDHVRVPRDALLDRFAEVGPDGRYSSTIRDPARRFFTMLGALVWGRVSIAAAAISASKSALTIAVRYGARRRQFGPPGGEETPILDYLTHQRRLMPALATTYALDFAQKRLVSELARQVGRKRVASRDRRRLEALAAGIKAYATWHATETIQTCREACGGQGYLAENRFAALRADADVFTTFEGDNTVLLQLVARGLLTDYREEFGDLDLLGMVRYVARRVVEEVGEAVPGRLVPDVLALVSGRDGDADLRSPEFLLASLRFREQHLLDGLARRLKKAIDKGEDPLDAFVSVQDHAVDTARANVERTILERFDATVRGVRNRGVAAVLGVLRDLYGLSRIEADRGWFQEHGQLSATQSKTVLRLVNELCGEARGHCEGLVDAFSIPDALLAAPIALATP